MLFYVKWMIFFYNMRVGFLRGKRIGGGGCFKTFWEGKTEEKSGKGEKKGKNKILIKIEGGGIKWEPKKRYCR